MTDLNITRDKKSKIGVILILPIFLFLIVFSIALILKSSSQPTYSFLWVAKTFEGFCVDPGKKPKDLDHYGPPCQNIFTYAIKNNALVQAVGEPMYREDLYFYDLAQHQNQSLSFEQAQKLRLISSDQAPQGFNLMSTHALNNLEPFPLYLNQYSYDAFDRGYFAIILEKNGVKLFTVLSEPNKLSQEFGPMSVQLLGWVQS